jgi:hypothetical protein
MERNIKDMIKHEAQKLICETHPSVCRLRDANYPHLEDMILVELGNNDFDISIQTALANLESDLGGSDTHTID